MKIGIDIDGVLTDYSKFCLDYGTLYYNVINPNEYDFSLIFGITKEEENIFWDKHRKDYFINTHARNFASEVIKKLISEGNEIYLITSRNFLISKVDDGSGKVEYTKSWLEKNDIPYNKLIFTPHDKVPTIINEKVEIMIEDSPNNIRSISEYIPVIKMDTRYNTDAKGNNIHTSYSWNDIYKMIHMKK